MVKFLIILLLLSGTAAHAFVEGSVSSSGLEDYSGYVVWIEEGDSLPAIKAEKQIKVMAQEGKEFVPGVAAIRSGDTVDFKNKDDVFHNVFSLHPSDRFDLGVFKGQEAFSDDKKTKREDRKADARHTFKGPGKIQVFCNIHPHMSGTVYTFSHGYYAAVDSVGNFKLPDVKKKGRLTVVLDGPGLEKPLKSQVNFPPEKKLTFKFKPTKESKVTEHKRKDGTEYPDDVSEMEVDEFY